MARSTPLATGIRSAPRRPRRGQGRARLLGTSQVHPTGAGKRNGRTRDGPRGRLFLVLGFTITDGKITDIDVVADPARLRQLDLAVLDGRRSAPRPHGVRRGPVAPAVSDRECPRRE